MQPRGHPAAKCLIVDTATRESLGSRLAAGETRALEDCYAGLGPLVLSYLRRYIPPADAEDVLQQVFLEVWRSSARYDASRSLEAWVLGIARHRAIDHLRRRRDVVPISDLHELVGDDGRDTVDRFVWAAEVRGALQLLPAEQREALELAYFSDCTQREISVRLGVPLGTVKARMARGMRRLAGLLAQEEDQ